MRTFLFALSFIFFTAAIYAHPASAPALKPAVKKAAIPARKLNLKISRETTYLTDVKLRPDGTPDYIEWLNRKYSKGVTPQNNAAIDLLEICGIGAYYEKPNPKKAIRIARLLGIKNPKYNPNNLRSRLYYLYRRALPRKAMRTGRHTYHLPRKLYDSLPKSRQIKFNQAFTKSIISGKVLDGKMREEVEAYINKVTVPVPDIQKMDYQKYSTLTSTINSTNLQRCPWDAQFTPETAYIIAINNDLLEKFKLASQKEYAFIPFSSTTGTFSAEASDDVIFVATASQHLAARAMFRIQNGHFDAGISDLTAINRLAELIRKFPNITFVNHEPRYHLLKLYYYRALAGIFLYENLSDQQIRKVQELIKAESEITDPSEFFEIHNRLSTLEKTGKLLLNPNLDLPTFYRNKPRHYPVHPFDKNAVDATRFLLTLPLDHNQLYSQINKWFNFRKKLISWKDPELIYQANSTYDYINPMYWEPVCDYDIFQICTNLDIIKTDLEIANPADRPKIAATYLAAVISKFFLSEQTRMLRNYLEARTMRNMLIITSAIFDYRFKKNQYPNKLSELVPNFLPQLPQSDFNPKDKTVCYRKFSRKSFVIFANPQWDARDRIQKLLNKQFHHYPLTYSHLWLYYNRDSEKQTPTVAPENF